MWNFILWPIRVVSRLLRYLIYWYWREPCGNVWVLDFAGDRESSEFRDQVDRALRFIREHDPRRADRVEQHLDYFINSSLIDAGGLYSREDRSCYLNYESYYQHVVGWDDLTSDAQQALTMKLASTIVHEATHARIEDAGVRYDEKYRERIERACRRQERHFMRRAAGDFRDACGQPYEDVYLRSLLSRHDNCPWREVPESLTGDRTLWVVDLNLDRIFLPGGSLRDNWVNCFVSQSGSIYSACLCDEILLDRLASPAAVPATELLACVP